LAKIAFRSIDFTDPAFPVVDSARLRIDPSK